MSEYHSTQYQKNIQERFESHVIAEPMSGCWLWTGGGEAHGYGHFKSGFLPTMRAHRIAWILYKGTIPEGMLVLHKCDTPACVNPLHLFLGTQFDNIHDCIKKRRFHKKHKLTKEQIIDIKNDVRSCRKLAQIYHVHYKTINLIRRKVI